MPAYGRAEPETVATDTSHGYYETGGEADAAWHSVLSREIKDADKAEFAGVRMRRVAMARGGPVAELFVLQYPAYPERLVGVKTAYTVESIAVCAAPPELDREGTSTQRAFARAADRGDAERLAELLTGVRRYTKADY